MATIIRYRGIDYTVEKCDGEAHSPEVGGMIDNCHTCMPSWGVKVRGQATGLRPTPRVYKNVVDLYRKGEKS